MFGKYCPIPLFVQVFIVSSVASDKDERENIAHSEDTVQVYSSTQYVHNNPAASRSLN